jgi:(1->4)-alpha-D-glucan 1-alpha-D-glucosylmutase
MTMPRLTATYRVQLNSSFTLADARRIVPYLDRLGVSHLYCSPVLKARRGSTHGYDVVDPTVVNPEIGTEDELRELARELHARGMGIVLDIVPNHMGVGAENPYWEDVLTHGERSRYARWFDIEWNAARNEHGRGRVVLPVLGAELAEVVERGELKLVVRESGTRLCYHEQSFPIDPETLPPEVQLAQFDPTAVTDPTELFGKDGGRGRLVELLEAQHYKLVFWRRATEELNYRRFFDVNDLAGVRQEDREVFAATHALVLRWVQEGVVDGLRVDHVDGLADPSGYLEQLREEVDRRRGAPPENQNTSASTPNLHHSDAFPILVEKILSPGESLRSNWPVQGTTGYEFLNDLEDIFISPDGYAAIDAAYRRMRRLPPDRPRFHDIAHESKLRVLQTALRPDVLRLARVLQPVAKAASRQWSFHLLANGLTEFIAALPVYRTYVDDRSAELHPDDCAVLDRTRTELRQRLTGSPTLDVALFVADVVAGSSGRRGAHDAEWLDFVRRLQQTTGPATAKGVEDTALYVYIPLTSRNEVGGGPDRPLADAVSGLHDANAKRAKGWPSALICTNTHDTKRSADLRARLDGLSEMPAEWTRFLHRWRRLNRRHRTIVRGRLTPDTNSEYLFYQTLVGLWPAPRPGRRVDDLPDREWRRSARDRLVQYMLKAAREAKSRTSWTEPDSEFENALQRFVSAVLEPAEEAPFLQDVARLVARLATSSAWRSLSRVVVHATSPGVMDIYRGDELWSFLLVDPDNRRPVEWERRCTLLDQVDKKVALADNSPDPGSPDPSADSYKLWLTSRLLRTRRTHADLFTAGAYRSLQATGERAAHVFAFARSHNDRCAITVVSRQASSPGPGGRTPNATWGNTSIALPQEYRGRSWVNVLDDVTIGAGEADSLDVSELFRRVPLALIVSS